MALSPVVVTLPNELIVMAPSVVPKLPMAPTLMPAAMPAAKTPWVVISPVEVMVTGP
jgi:hypothetical protein